MTTTFDTLYARDSKGKILQWNVEVQSSNGQVDIKLSYGEYDGAQTIRWQRNIQGKNKGKANATNSYEQAVLEVESIIRNKKKKGYMTLEEAKELNPFQDDTRPIKFNALIPTEKDTLWVQLNKYLPKNRLDADGDIKPMKAQQYYRSKKNWTAPDGTEWTDRKYYYLKNPLVTKEPKSIITKFPCMGQPKINGVRATIQLSNNNVLIKSKEGKVYNIHHINDFLNINNDIFTYNGIELILDGELYIHGELLQDIGSAVDKPNLNTPRIKFILFDIAVENIPNENRWNIIKSHIKPKLDIHLNCPIELIKTVRINNDSMAQQFTDINISKGYEGTIFRSFTGYYAFGKRPQDMTKLKRLLDTEFKIIDVIPQDKDDTKGNFICITDEGLQFAVNPQGTDDFKREILSNKNNYIGKNLTCSFYEWTKDLKPFHIVTSTVRDYE